MGSTHRSENAMRILLLLLAPKLSILLLLLALKLLSVLRRARQDHFTKSFLDQGGFLWLNDASSHPSASVLGFVCIQPSSIGSPGRRRRAAAQHGWSRIDLDIEQQRSGSVRHKEAGFAEAREVCQREGSRGRQNGRISEARDPLWDWATGDLHSARFGEGRVRALAPP